MINIYSLNTFDLLRSVERHSNPNLSIDALAFKQIAEIASRVHYLTLREASQYAKADQSERLSGTSFGFISFWHARYSGDYLLQRAKPALARSPAGSLAWLCRPPAGQASLRSACKPSIIAVLPISRLLLCCISARNIVLLYYSLLYDFNKLECINSTNG